MELNIPIYRAKKIDSDEYVVGYVTKSECDDDFLIRANGEYHFIDVSTSSIHFPNMLDVEDDKIFASLQEFGTGGDIITDGEYDFVVIFNGRSFDLMFVEDNTFTKFNEWDDWNKFTKKGIQQ